MELDGKVALVTGGGSGIGAETARLFARNGAAVVLADVAEDDAAKVVADIEAQGGRAIARRCDVSVSDDARAAVHAAVEAFGGLDVLVSNAAIRPVGDNDVVSLTEETWDRIYAVNVKGTFFMTKHAVPELRRRGGGAILITSSASSLNAMPGYLAYGSAKAALNFMTKSLALELAPDRIRVNAVVPGSTLTPLTAQVLDRLDPDGLERFDEMMRRMNPLGGKMLDPIDTAQAFLFLASDRARLVTGQSVVVDAGWSIMLHQPTYGA